MMLVGHNPGSTDISRNGINWYKSHFPDVGNEEIKEWQQKKHLFSCFNFFKLWKYDNTYTGDLENTEQGYI